MRALALLALLLTACTTKYVVVGPTQGPDVGVVTALRHTLLMEEGCTAVNIGRGWVLTAKHCVDELNFLDKTSVGFVAYQAPKRDFAVLFDVARKKDPSVCVRKPALGEHVYAVGYPVQRETRKQALTITDGIISTVEAIGTGEIRTSTPIFFGNSGGGLWGNDGCLVGLTVAAFMDTAENYIVPAGDLPEAVAHVR